MDRAAIIRFFDASGGCATPLAEGEIDYENGTPCGAPTDHVQIVTTLSQQLVVTKICLECMAKKAALAPSLGYTDLEGALVLKELVAAAEKSA